MRQRRESGYRFEALVGSENPYREYFSMRNHVVVIIDNMSGDVPCVEQFFGHKRSDMSRGIDAAFRTLQFDGRGRIVRSLREGEEFRYKGMRLIHGETDECNHVRDE